MTLTFTIPGPPVPWKRDTQDRFTGRRVTEKRTRAYESHVRSCAAVAMMRAGLRPWNGPCALGLTLYVKDLRRRDNGNMLKAIEDGANRVVWTDDSWILVHDGIHRYLDRENPRAVVTVRFMDEWDAWKAEP